jgi:hypothetical protein
MISCPKCDELMDMSRACAVCGWNGRKPNESEDRYKKRKQKEDEDKDNHKN